MIVREIEIVNFRNIARAKLSFSPSFNLISGRNAQGKTNLLEAIHLFSLGRLFRARGLEEAVRFGEEHLFCGLGGRSDAGVDFGIGVGFERGGRTKVEINGKRATGLAEIVGLMPSVIFVAEDVSIAAGAPAGRRTYLDYTAAQISPLFLRELREYRRTLRQRNAILEAAARACAAPDGIEAWDEALAAKGAAVVRIRRETMLELAGRAAALFEEIAGPGSAFAMEYACSFDPSGEHLEEALAGALARAREAERRRGFTMAGPQYDDMRLFLEGVELRRYGSQGSKRLAALILKLAQALVIAERRGERPVVILDDIFSELDAETAEAVRRRLAGGYQSFLATPRPEEAGTLPAGAAHFVVESGAFAARGEGVV